MKINLEKVIPLPIKGQMDKETEVWGKKNIEIKKGENIIVKASSGKGKTTLLSIIYGLRKDYEGEVYINDENIRNFSLDKWTELRQNKISYVFQGLDMFEELTVLENIQLKNKLTEYYNENTIIDFAKALNIERYITQKAATLSFGQRQRAAIVRALCQPFDFLLLDEPFSHIDNENIKDALKLIDDECRKRNASFILASLDNDYNFKFNRTIKI